jgi:hypothetical protein
VTSERERATKSRRVVRSVNIQTSMYGNQNSVKKCEISNWIAYVITDWTVSGHMAYPSDRPFRRYIKGNWRLRLGICRVVRSLINPNGNTAYQRGGPNSFGTCGTGLRSVTSERKRVERVVAEGRPGPKSYPQKQDSMGFPSERVLNDERGSARQNTSVTL